jgi:arsenate reductase (thioredoxin)
MMEARTRVLFLCTGNSCRSQIAEGWLRHLAGDRFESLSAGTDPEGLNPRAIATMAEVGIDISAQRSEAISSYLEDPLEVVITVCDRAATSCPTLPGATELVRWSFPDPAEARGSEAELLAVFAKVRDSIRARVEEWVATR